METVELHSYRVGERQYARQCVVLFQDKRTIILETNREPEVKISISIARPELRLDDMDIPPEVTVTEVYDSNDLERSETSRGYFRRFGNIIDIVSK